MIHEPCVIMYNCSNLSALLSPITLALLGSWAVAQPGGTPEPHTTITPLSEGIYLASADLGFLNFRDFSWTFQDRTSDQILKRIDLSGLSDDTWDRLEAARIAVFMYAEDLRGNGLNETFDLVVNGHVNTFPTEGLVKNEPGWYDHSLALGWFYFPCDVQQLKKGLNEIILRKSEGTVDGDDQLCLGIDVWGGTHSTFRSTDGGQNWFTKPLNHLGKHGEGMVRVILFTDPASPDAPLPHHDALPALPPIDLNPPVKPLPLPNADVTLTSPLTKGGLEGGDNTSPLTKGGLEGDDNTDVFANGWFRVAVSHADGLSLSALVHRPMGVDGLRDGKNSGLFTVEVDDKKFSSRDFAVESRETRHAGSEQRVVVYFLRHQAAQLAAQVTFTQDRSHELKVGLSVRNLGAEKRLVKVAFPLLSGVRWSEEAEDDYCLYPYTSGAILNRPVKFLNGYGGTTVYIQMMASYAPALGGGLYLRVNDRSGQYKILHLTKTDEQTPEPSFSFEELRIDMLHQRAEPELILLEPYNPTPGTSMAFSHFGRRLEPNQLWVLPAASLGFFNGDWRAAMQAYRDWFESGSHQRPYPNKLTGVFNLEGISAAHHFHGPDGYNTNINRWGHRPVFDEGRSKTYFSRTPDILEHTSYWEWDEVTDEYMAQFQKVAEQYGRDFTLWPGRHGEVEGKHYIWGQQGDYGLQGYNERWGGLPAFRRYLNEMKRKGFVVTLYINEGEAALSSLIGQRHGPEWGIKLKGGSYFWPYWMWEMCLDNPLWRRYLADTCRRLIEETGADGIRIDEFGGAARVCYNDQHLHTFAEPGHYACHQAQAEACREIRQAVDQVDRDAVLMSESPGIDVMWQYLDGSLSYDLSCYALTGSRAKDWEGFVGINIFRFYFPRFKFFDYEMQERHPAWRFFNATGAFNREWFYRDNELQILQENADAYGTLHPQPLLPTLLPRVYVNAFPAAEKTLYHLYNARHSAVEGNLLVVENPKGTHFVDLLRGHEIRPRRRDGQRVLPISLPPRSVTCVAQLPRVLAVTENGRQVTARLTRPLEEAEALLMDGTGKVLVRERFSKGKVRLQRPQAGAFQGFLLLKLHRRGKLVDAWLVTR